MVHCCSGRTVDNVKPKGGGATAAGRALRTAPLQDCRQLWALGCPPPSPVSALETQQRPPWVCPARSCPGGARVRPAGPGLLLPRPCSSEAVVRVPQCLSVCGRERAAPGPEFTWGPVHGQAIESRRALHAGRGVLGVPRPRPLGSPQMPVCLMSTDLSGSSLCPPQKGQSENSPGSQRFPQTHGSAVTRAAAS